MDYTAALAAAIETAQLAGELLRADLHRGGGARGHIDKAEADTEAERLIRERLLAAFPSFGFLGEETGRVLGDPVAPIWLIDPNDGTRDFLKGMRGSAVSIALLHERSPVLGVVHAFSYPDDCGDLFAWAEGCGPLRRNGLAVTPALPASLGPTDVVLVSSGGDGDPAGHLRCVAPARYRVVPSIAHRLALAAAGEAAAAVSLHAPGAWDYAAGQALLRGAGAVLVDETGAEIRYAADGTSHARLAFGGMPAVVRILAGRPWREVGQGAAPSLPALARLSPGATVKDPELLARAQGCLLGQVAGDSLGSLVESTSSAEIAQRYPGGPLWLEDGGVWDTLAGQPTDDSEMALAMARSVLAAGTYDPRAARAAYRDWVSSGPFDIGNTIHAALSGRATPHSRANGSLMRVSPIGIFTHCLSPKRTADFAREDSDLTHPNPVCGDACAAYCVALAHAVREGSGPRETWSAALEWARTAPASIGVIEALQRAEEDPPACDETSQGFVLLTLQNAFHELLHAASLEEGIVATVRRGGDSDTNAAVAGALLGAVYGRNAVPPQWRSMILSCRPHETAAARRPRPMVYWPVDVLELAERLLLEGRRAY